ncbi:MAG: alkaline phosphatase, partial [Alphaproteobacteria bacterium]|nr:alkaline phosphatase [Alphaproteobacteria bacterium]
FFTFQAQAKSVILMIGDGMGNNHISCTEKDYPLFLSVIPSAYVRTASFDNPTTDSAAAATAYACGIKTKNSYLGMAPDNTPCTTIAEEALQNDTDVYILTTDNQYGATPSAFYAHVTNRYKNAVIDEQRDAFAAKSYLRFDIPSLQEAVKELIPLLEQSDKQYFVMIEGAKIDKASHHRDFSEMEKQMTDFDGAVEKIWQFSQNHPVNVYVTADHETGGLRADTCEYLTANHTQVNVPLWIFGDAFEPQKTYENTEIYLMMKKALFE